MSTAIKVIEWLRQHVPETAQLCLDSRQLTAGDVFVACPGVAGDGRDFIEAAIENGAVAVVTEAFQQPRTLSVPVLEVVGLQALLGEVAHEWWGRPSEAMTVMAVTGTNGKTSSVQWLAGALNNSTVPCGTIGTLGVTLPDGTNLGGALTTPDVLTMHQSLARLRAAGANLVALEASSIGIEQGRLDGVNIAIAAFTNLSHDHLDYHETFENYQAAKKRLFHWPGLQTAVINADDAFGRELLSQPLHAKKVSYSLQDMSADVVASDVHHGADGQVFTLQTAHGQAQILTHLLGEHNVANLLLVSGILTELGWPVSKIARLMATLGPVAGRLEIVNAVAAIAKNAPAPLVVVDYAHSPDALERALHALRGVATIRGGKLKCIFGCGGDRDRAKRPIMGSIAAALADEVVLTNDNPRSEEPDDILKQILDGIDSSAAHTRVQPDRAKAILETIWQAEPADLILIAGKGHETYQEIKGQRFTFDDRQWGSFALSWLRGVNLSTDTRTLQPNDLFVALNGERFDGHAYLDLAREKGACAAIVSAPHPEVNLPQFVLGDTRQALITIATVWRQRFSIPVVAICGSNGKTTTKEMVARIFRAQFGQGHTVATVGNLNNDLGVPLSVLRLRPEHQAAVFELGMNHPGEIAVLTAIAQPTVALVNNAQREHQEFLHTVEAVAQENGEVIRGLADQGVAVFPNDEPYTALWQEYAGERSVVRFGFAEGAEVSATTIHAGAESTGFTLTIHSEQAKVKLPAPGVHNLRNALAASACAWAIGIELPAIIEGLQSFKPVQGRMQPKTVVPGFQLIDDSYNANPDSVRAAIDVLAQLEGERVLVLGDMSEVGVQSQAVHAEVGNYARDQGIGHLLVLGNDAKYAAQAYGEAAQVVESLESLVEELIALMPAHVLIKGSRSARMDRVVTALEQHFSDKDGASHVA